MLFFKRHDNKTYHCVAALLSVLFLAWIVTVRLWWRNSPDATQVEVKIFERAEVPSTVAAKASEVVDKKKIKQHVPKFMLELYESSRRKDGSDVPDVVRSLVPKSTGTLCDSETLETSDDNHLLIFDLPETNQDEILLEAELRILTLIELNSEVLNGVERVVKLSIFNLTSKSFDSIHEIHVYHTNNTWLTFNLTNTIKSILLSPKTVKTLKVIISIKAFVSEVHILSGKLTLSLLPLSDELEHDYPILLLSYTSKKSKKGSTRVKRNIEDEYEEETNIVFDDELQSKMQLKKYKRMRNTCRRRPLYVDFSEIRYDEWIVQPRGYEAFQCQGKCFYPVAEHLSPTKHAIIQILLHSVAPTRISRPCCVPTKLAAISILYVDDAGVVTYRYAYNDMVVTECGCR